MLLGKEKNLAPQVKGSKDEWFQADMKSKVSQLALFLYNAYHLVQSGVCCLPISHAVVIADVNSQMKKLSRFIQ